jgi:putative sigma-54 modulation protein
MQFIAVTKHDQGEKCYRIGHLRSFTMPVECTGRQVVITKPLRTLAEEGIERIAKILGRITSAHVVLTAEKYRQIAEVTVKTRACTLVALCESSNSMESALHDALAKAETQATRHKDRQRTRKRQPKQEKQVEEPEIARSGRGGDAESNSAKAANGNGSSNGKNHAQPAIPVTVHSFPARAPIPEPHIVRSLDSVALRPMTLEEAVKEAEFRDRDVFVFRDNEGNVKVLHRKRDGKMELIEAP